MSAFRVIQQGCDEVINADVFEIRADGHLLLLTDGGIAAAYAPSHWEVIYALKTGDDNE